MSRHQNVGGTRNINTGNKSKLCQVQTFGKGSTNGNYIHYDVKSTLNSGNACYNLFQFSSVHISE